MNWSQNISYAPPAAGQASWLPAKPSRREMAARGQGVILVAGLTAATLAGTAAVGGLRLADLMVSLPVMAWITLLAYRDRKHLTTAVIGVWVFSRLVRRLVDWQLGGFTSLTAISLLPMLATATLLIPVIPRWPRVPRELRQALWFMTVPVLISTLMGLVRYGASAAPEAGGWLVPLLFVPYLATRPMDDAERWSILRAGVLVCVASALYGVYQFLTMPPWDAMWLVQSGSTSSMGDPERLKMRVWGTLASSGTAGIIWALALVAAFADRGWRIAWRGPVVTALCAGLTITLVRGGWVSAVAGVACFVMLTRGRDGAKVAFVAVLAGLVLFFAVPHLPGGDRIGKRLQTFQNLESDGSANARVNITRDLVVGVARNPLGTGIGFKTAGKVAGESDNIAPVDNGYGDVLLTLGPLGGLTFFGGMLLLVRRLRHTRRRKGGRRALLLAPLALATLTATGMMNILAFSFGEISGAWCWLTVGLALGVAAAPETGHSR